MKVALVGATGFVGSKILMEAVSRGHAVTAVSRNPERLPQLAGMEAVATDVNNVSALTAAFRGKDAVIHAYAAPRSATVQERIDQQTRGTMSIIAAMKAAGTGRILAVGGAGSLYLAPGVRVMDTILLPKRWEGGAKSTALIKDMLQAEPLLDWTFLCPALYLEPGKRTQKYRVGSDELLIEDATGRSYISLEDYAVALIDELERPQHSRKRFTVGY
jgi:uncharacterized protein